MSFTITLTDAEYDALNTRIKFLELTLQQIAETAPDEATKKLARSSLKITQKIKPEAGAAADDKSAPKQPASKPELSRDEVAKLLDEQDLARRLGRLDPLS